MRDYLKYHPVDEKTIQMHCSNAAKEIEAMVNHGAEANSLLNRWNTEGKNKQATILSQITGLDLDISHELFSAFNSIAEVLKSDQESLSKILSSENLQLLKPFLYD